MREIAVNAQPRRADLIWLTFRVAILRMRRLAVNLMRPIPRFDRVGEESFPISVATHRSRLRYGSLEERNFELGKIHNLRRAARELNGLKLRAGEEFSFWRHVGKCTASRGFVPGRQIQEGCLVPAVGGGICQLSNALYDVALKSGCEITERHGHTRIVPGSLAEEDRDATVAWNHIDLRFRVPKDMRLGITLTTDDLVVSLSATEVIVSSSSKRQPVLLRQVIDGSHACGTCDQVACLLFPSGEVRTVEQSAFLVDEVWPEFDAYLQGVRSSQDILLRPLGDKLLRRPQYEWTTCGFAELRQAPWETLVRGYRSRKLAHQGAARQQARLDSARDLALAYAKQIPYTVTHLVVTLELLPFLNELGVLGGRTFDVLMTRLPIIELQSRLDSAHSRHPERTLLADYRADEKIARLEAQALRLARHLITPHRDVGANDPRRVLLDWHFPSPRERRLGSVVAFPGPSVSRKGAYEMREVAQEMGFAVRAMGSQLEGLDFWSGCKLAPPEGDWLDGVAVVVQPAVVEDRPRRLLEAIASDCPVICTPACGLDPGALITLVPEGDVTALANAIKSVFAF